jgi:hypothetical protein
MGSFPYTFDGSEACNCASVSTSVAVTPAAFT